MGNCVKSVGSYENVFVVDDDPSMRNLLAEELRFRGYSVIVARTDAEALTVWDGDDASVIVPRSDDAGHGRWTFMSAIEINSAADPLRSLLVRAGAYPPVPKRSV